MKTKLLAILALLFMSTIVMSYATPEMITVQGIVLDENSDPLHGVTVIVEGTRRASVTNVDGRYSIKAAVGEKLVFDYLGYQKQTITITNSTHNVTLVPDVMMVIDEIMVMAQQSSSSSKIDLLSEDEPITTKKFSRAVGSSTTINGTQSNYKESYNYDMEQNEEYGSFAENRFKMAKAEPLSTFSADVDMASYSNVRRFINMGQKPPKGAVRVEEMINYFSYQYPKPTSTDPVSITTEVGACPWNSQNRLVRVGIKAREIESENLPTSNFIFLIDVSGSMDSPTRLGLVKSSLKLLINNLRKQDRVAIVVYAGEAGLALEATSGEDKQKIREALDNLDAGGSTAGGEGIELAYKVAKKNFIKGGNNRIILCTDGDFNVGVSSDEGLEDLIVKQSKSCVFLSILGYGMGNYKDEHMQILAQKGNGNHAYIDNMQEANKVLVSEFGGTTCTVAKDVKLQVEFNPANVQAYRLVGYESRLLDKEDFNDDTKDAGEMGAGHTVTAFYEIVPVGVKSNMLPLVDDLKYQSNPQEEVYSGRSSAEMLTVKLRYKEPQGDVSSKLERTLADGGGNNVSADFHFAAAVAMFGQLLSDSDFKGDATYDKVVDLAKKGLKNDPQGYRREFVRLVNAAKGLE